MDDESRKLSEELDRLPEELLIIPEELVRLPEELRESPELAETEDVPWETLELSVLVSDAGFDLSEESGRELDSILEINPNVDESPDLIILEYDDVNVVKTCVCELDCGYEVNVEGPVVEDTFAIGWLAPFIDE